MVGTRVYVGGLAYGIREKDIERFFKGYGRIRDVLIKNGYGFVEFEDYRDADDAVYELNGKELLGERVTVERARGIPRDNRGQGMGRNMGGRSRDGDRGGRGAPRGSDKSGRYGPPTRTEYRLTVENLSSRVSWQDLKDYMRQAGEVTYADAHKQRRNEGVVEFASYTDMKAAIDKLDDTELNGRRIRLVEDRGRGRGGRRSRSSSRSKSRSRSRSRRRSRSGSRSRSKSKSKSKSKSRSRSKSRSKSRSRSKSADSRKSKSRSPEDKAGKEVSRSRSRSRSKSRDDKSKSRSRSRSASKERDSRSRSKSPEKNGDRYPDQDMKDEDNDD